MTMRTKKLSAKGLPMSEPTMSDDLETLQVWARLTTILDRLAVTGRWAHDDERSFLEQLTSADDQDLADLARERINRALVRH